MTSASTSSDPADLMYLSFESWSPRFDSNFFAIKMEGKEMLQSAPEEIASVSRVPPGKQHYPAHYYRIEVFQSRKQHAVLRRYSQFRWLFDQVKSYTPPQGTIQGELPQLDPMVFPPKTCPWQTQDESFTQNRLEQLREFLTDALKRPGVASHPAITRFLALDVLAEDN